MNKYRDKGAVGALLDEYEKAIIELSELISTVSHDELLIIVDPDTSDADCRSIQTILRHVVRAGFYYFSAIRENIGLNVQNEEYHLLDSVKEYMHQLRDMFNHAETLFNEYPDIQLENMTTEGKMLVRWGQHYDVEQLFEHAIVHILRHRRQIERFLLKLRDN